MLDGQTRRLAQAPHLQAELPKIAQPQNRLHSFASHLAGSSTIPAFCVLHQSRYGRCTPMRPGRHGPNAQLWRDRDATVHHRGAQPRPAPGGLLFCSRQFTKAFRIDKLLQSRMRSEHAYILTAQGAWWRRIWDFQVWRPMPCVGSGHMTHRSLRLRFTNDT